MEIKSFSDLDIVIERNGKRAADEIREAKIPAPYLNRVPGSVLIEMGDTKVLCVATCEEKLPRWLMAPGVERHGWLTAEYDLLPFAGGERKASEISQGKISGRTHEIQRLVGRSLRAAVDLEALGERTIWIDCTVLQADGGTRTASVTGGFVALSLLVKDLLQKKVLKKSPIIRTISAISVGRVDGRSLLDLDYSEDSRAEVDCNLVMTGEGEFIEIQGTAEGKPFPQDVLNEFLSLGKKGCQELLELQKPYLEGAF
ncbi:ribonuclease PH [bacterium]|nr:ribonuclease PH [bacterium]